MHPVRSSDTPLRVALLRSSEWNQSRTQPSSGSSPQRPPARAQIRVIGRGAQAYSDLAGNSAHALPIEASQLPWLKAGCPGVAAVAVIRGQLSGPTTQPRRTRAASVARGAELSPVSRRRGVAANVRSRAAQVIQLNSPTTVQNVKGCIRFRHGRIDETERMLRGSPAFRRPQANEIFEESRQKVRRGTARKQSADHQRLGDRLPRRPRISSPNDVAHRRDHPVVTTPGTSRLLRQPGRGLSGSPGAVLPDKAAGKA